MSVDRIPVTRAGAAALKNEIKRLKSVERPKVIEALAEARAHGDLSENADYDAAKDRQSFHRGPPQGHRGQALAGRGRRRREDHRRQGSLRSDGHARGRGRRRGRLSDRRGHRSRHQEGQDQHPEPHRSRAHRPRAGRVDHGEGPEGQRAGVRDPPRGVPGRGHRRRDVMRLQRSRRLPQTSRAWQRRAAVAVRDLSSVPFPGRKGALNRAGADHRTSVHRPVGTLECRGR